MAAQKRRREAEAEAVHQAAIEWRAPHPPTDAGMPTNVCTTGATFQRILKRVCAASSCGREDPPVDMIAEAQRIIKKARASSGRHGSSLDIGGTLGEPVSNADVPAPSKTDEAVVGAEGSETNHSVADGSAGGDSFPDLCSGSLGREMVGELDGDESCGASSAAAKRAIGMEAGQVLNKAQWRAVDCESANGASSSAEAGVGAERSVTSDSAGDGSERARSGIGHEVAAKKNRSNQVDRGVSDPELGPPNASSTPRPFDPSRAADDRAGASEGVRVVGGARRADGGAGHPVVAVAICAATDDACESAAAKRASDDSSNLAATAAKRQAFDCERASCANEIAQQPSVRDDVDSLVSVQSSQKDSLGVTGQGVGQEEKPPPHPFTP